ncbi:hypothetical protein BVX99_01565 [bacterium F16]|nr:hypothetical protein BVX99_01565 [bacterium F16]
MGIQFEFNFSEPEDEIDVSPEAATRSSGLSRRLLRRAALAWLVKDGADGVALNVPTRISRFKADAAGVWCEAIKNPASVGPRQVLSPSKTVVIECRCGREDCWPDCSNSHELSPKLKDLHKQMDALCADIRRKEPHLRCGDALFDEYADWKYDETGNLEFHSLTRQIRKLELALYKGTRFEGIKKSRIADFAYLCVPEGAIEPHELAEGWGLLWVDNQLNIRTIVPAENVHCLVENRLHLAQNIALANRESVLFENGVRESGNSIQFVALPVRRRKVMTFSPED